MPRDPIGHGNLNVTICFIHERSFKILLTYTGARLNKKRNISCRRASRGARHKLKINGSRERELCVWKRQIHETDYSLMRIP